MQINEMEIRRHILKSQLLYRLSYGLQSLTQQRVLRDFWRSDCGRNGNRTHIYGTQRVTSIVASLRIDPSPVLGVLIAIPSLLGFAVLIGPFYLFGEIVTALRERSNG